ncbi:MAG: PIN domain-containing protein [Chloroflexota bacterium]
MVLPDTSVWVEFSRRGKRGRAARLGELLDAGEVATCGPVAAELLAGAEGEVAERLWETLDSLPWAELRPRDWRRAGTLAGTLRREGEALPLTDLAIAVAAASAGHDLWSFDTDFERIAAALPELRVENRLA